MYLFNDLFRITITFKIHYVDDLSPASWGFICLIFLMDDIYVLVLDFRQLLPWSRSFPWRSIAERSVAELSAPMLWCLNPNSLKVHSSIKTSRINCTRKRLYVLIERTIWRTLNVPPFEWGGGETCCEWNKYWTGFKLGQPPKQHAARSFVIISSLGT